MSALETARRVLRWAAAPSGPPPAAPLRDVPDLATPAPADVAALARLTAETAARLGAGRPPFGDAGPIGGGALLLAAAIGGRVEAERAELVADAAAQRGPGPVGWADELARLAVVWPAVYPGLLRRDHPRAGGRHAGLPEPLVARVLRAAPLAGVLLHPGAADRTAAASFAAQLVRRPRGPEVFAGALADPDAGAVVLTWRAELLDRLRLDRPAAVLEVFVTARLRHGPAWTDRVTWAGRRLSSLVRLDDADAALAVATVRYWAVLAALATAEPALVTARPFLEGHEPALRLARRYGFVGAAGPATEGATR
ncbi:hypothetical protein AB0K00_41930 [Dactylosporangium sp. NPDC049525]|uniref:hypothetical protein n=1 Tax=Dactylosporangium sp. NPDC049525 TaxID=3154730 RepID=UPI003418772C